MNGARKILAMLLDKQPRWLRPRDVEDSVRRLSQLYWPPTPMGSISYPNRAPPPPLSLPSEKDYRSTDEPTTKIKEILSKYPESYAKLVKNFVNGFSAPVSHFAGNQPASVQETMNELSWSDDRQQADPFDGKPYPLPGDFLRLDSSEMCDHGSEGHRRRCCLCIARTELFNALFITPVGPTPLGRRLIDGAPSNPEECRLQDAFGNTLLHLLAARGNTDGLSFYLQQEVVSRIINYQNSSGQTFLHVLDLQQVHPDTLSRILDWLIITEYLDGSKFNFSLRDYYGRTFFHILLAADKPRYSLESILQRFHLLLLSSRDAFNLTPSPLNPTQQSQPTIKLEPQLYPDNSNPAIAKEIRLMQTIQHCWQYPGYEDSKGRNGLQCLAAVILSKTNMELRSRPHGHRRPAGRGRLRTQRSCLIHLASGLSPAMRWPRFS
jgi:hypothetical protein